MKRAVIAIAVLTLVALAVDASILRGVWARRGVAASTGITITGANSTTTNGGYVIHTWTTNGSMTVTTGGTIEYLLVGAGGTGGKNGRGGGGGGQVVTGSMTLAAGTYTNKIGVDDDNWVSNNRSATESMATRITNDTVNLVALGGNDGSDPGGGTQYAAGGAGGTTAGAGATGTVSAITGSSVYYAGGGGGGDTASGGAPGGAGGVSGGGTGGTWGGGSGSGTAGSPNTGGGGGGEQAGGPSNTGKRGGTGVIIVRYAQ
jgi:hypothetical protein